MFKSQDAEQIYKYKAHLQINGRPKVIAPTASLVCQISKKLLTFFRRNTTIIKEECVLDKRSECLQTVNIWSTVCWIKSGELVNNGNIKRLGEDFNNM